MAKTDIGKVSISQVKWKITYFVLKHGIIIYHQIAMEVDWSSGHMKYDNNALRVIHMNAGWGGKQLIMRDTILTSADLDTRNAIYQPGDRQSMFFNNPLMGPLYDPNAPMLDTPYTPEEVKRNPRDPSTKPNGWLGKAKGIKQVLWERCLWKDGMKCKMSAKEKLKCLMENRELRTQDLDMDYTLSNCFD